MFRKPASEKPPFIHADDCVVVKADPNVEIPWSEVERGHWVATCVCTTEHYREPRTRPARLDPLDPLTAHHLPRCEFASETSHAVLTILLKVTERDGYWWCECGSCQAAWQVPFVAESIGAWR
jgi:hypothetical protein